VDDVRSESEEPVSEDTENNHANGHIKGGNKKSHQERVGRGDNGVVTHNHTKAG